MSNKNTKKKSKKRPNKKRTRAKTKQKINRKKTNHKKKNTEKIVSKSIDKILTNIHIILSLPSIEFLPSSTIFNNNNEGHYLLMSDFQELAAIINKQTHYKKSPTIQKIFNYRSYDIEDEENIVFNYNNIRCDNLIIKEQKNDNVKLLFLYLLECNVYHRFKEIIQLGGEYDINSMLDYDIHKKEEYEKEDREKKEKEDKELENIRRIEEAKFNERLRLEKENIERNKEIQKEITEINNKNEKTIQKDLSIHNTNIDKELDNKIDDQKDILEKLIDKKEDLNENKEDILDEKEEVIKKEYEINEEKEDKLEEEEYKEKQKRIDLQNKLKKQIEMKVKGFEEYLESKKVYNISKNSFAMYNINWFNVCCGLETYDDFFEKEVEQKITELGLVINQEEIKDLLLTLFEDKDEYAIFRNIIRNRLITCCEFEEPSFFERYNPFSNTLGIFKDCDKKSPQSILYLYDDYRKFIEKKMEISRLDRILILIYCEIRQETLSKYISFEIMRRSNEKNKRRKIINILDKIMHSDKKLIKHNNQLLKKQNEDEYNNYKRKRLNEIKRQMDVKATIYNDKIIVQKNKLGNLMEQKEIQTKNMSNTNQEKNTPGIFERLWKIFEKNKESVDFELNLTPNEKKAYQKAMKKMKGGSQEHLLQYKMTKNAKQNVCNKIKDEKNIYLDQLQLIDDCFD